MFPAFLIACAGLQVWAWRNLIPRVRSGALSWLQGTARFTGWAFLSVPLFAAGFLALVGLEELLHAALIGERAALLVLPVLALAAVGSIAFALSAAFVVLRRRRASRTPRLR